MTQEELKTIVAQMLRQMSGLDREPPVKGADYTPTRQPVENNRQSVESIPDITKTDIRRQYLVHNPADSAGFLTIKQKTPARIGLGRAGTRYKTITMLRFRADHAAAQDSVFSQVGEEFYQHMTHIHTQCRDKDEYLTRPDLGRRFDEEMQIVIKAKITTPVALIIGDGLSSAAIEANAMDCAAAIQQGLKGKGIACGEPIFVQYCRVGASDHIGELTGCEVVCMLVGERPGLVTNESMSCYITYQPRLGIPESKRTVISNIHRQGTPALEAGAHIADLIEEILKQKASGVDLRQEAAT